MTGLAMTCRFTNGWNQLSREAPRRSANSAEGSDRSFSSVVVQRLSSTMAFRRARLLSEAGEKQRDSPRLEQWNLSCSSTLAIRSESGAESRVQAVRLRLVRLTDLPVPGADASLDAWSVVASLTQCNATSEGVMASTNAYRWKLISDDLSPRVQQSKRGALSTTVCHAFFRFHESNVGTEDNRFECWSAIALSEAASKLTRIVKLYGAYLGLIIASSKSLYALLGILQMITTEDRMVPSMHVAGLRRPVRWLSGDTFSRMPPIQGGSLWTTGYLRLSGKWYFRKQLCEATASGKDGYRRGCGASTGVSRLQMGRYR
nr:hypothetical protein Iba_chr04aCG19970 [Ipomoea batatas]